MVRPNPGSLAYRAGTLPLSYRGTRSTSYITIYTYHGILYSSPQKVYKNLTLIQHRYQFPLKLVKTWHFLVVFNGVVYGVPHLILYTKMFVLVCCFEIQRLPPWQTLHNCSIKDGVQDGCRFLKSTPIPKMHHIFHVFAL